MIATKLAGGEDPITIVSGPELDPPAELALLSLHESGGYLFLRYGVKGSLPDGKPEERPSRACH